MLVSHNFTSACIILLPECWKNKYSKKNGCWSCQMQKKYCNVYFLSSNIFAAEDNIYRETCCQSGCALLTENFKIVIKKVPQWFQLCNNLVLKKNNQFRPNCSVRYINFWCVWSWNCCFAYFIFNKATYCIYFLFLFHQYDAMKSI